MPGLTGLRGIGAIWVMLFHLFFGSDVWVLSHGYLGVDIFFVLSGFILSHVYTPQLRETTPSSYAKFLKLRLARIYPLHFVSLTVLGLIVLFVPGFAERYKSAERLFSGDAFVASLLLVQNWIYWPPLAWNGPSWSLSAEWFLYLLFPLFLPFVRHIESGMLALVLGCATLLALLAVAAAKSIPLDAAGTPGMMRALFEFTAGCLFFRAHVAGIAAIRQVGLIALCWAISSTYAQSISNATALFASAAAVLLAARGSGPVAWLLSRRPMLFLGEISYSLYMLHWIVIQLSNWAQDSLEFQGGLGYRLAIGTLILTISTVSYYVLERPARELGRWLALGRRYRRIRHGA